MPNRPGYKPRDARLALSPRKRLQDALCRKALLQRDHNDHRRNVKIRDEWPVDERATNGGGAHGTLTMYQHHKCRCDACRKARADYRREYERR